MKDSTATRDGVGDTPYEIRAYADRIWMDTPMARFFRSSPILELLDFPRTAGAVFFTDADPARHGPVAHRRGSSLSAASAPERHADCPRRRHLRAGRIDANERNAE